VGSPSLYAAGRWASLSVGTIPVHLAEPVRRRRHGVRPPKLHGTLYVSPADVVERIDPEHLPAGRLREVFGRVIVRSDWDLRRRRLSNGRKRRVLTRLAQGFSPEQSGYLAWMERQAARPGWNHGCKTAAQIMGRADVLVSMIAEIRATGRLRRRAEVERWSFRERGGIGIAIARDGTLIKTSNGDHRLFFAQGLELSAIPVAVVAVHPLALKNGSWARRVAHSDLLEQALQDDAALR